MKVPNEKTAVFTTTDVARKKLPIVYVSHDIDGDWQFFSSETVPTKEAMIVSLGEIIALDPSIKEILQIPPGTEAHRTSPSDDWMIIGKN